MFQKNKILIVIVGPTAVGKTSLCLKLAQHFGSEILSADSRQFFKEMEIGTAKPSPLELKLVHHYFINTLSIRHEYDVRQYEQDALKILEAIFCNHNVAILTGGSGLYVKAVTQGFDEMPESDPKTREALNEVFLKEGIAALRDQLKQVDPVYYNVVDLQNPQRIIRALEVFQISGRPFSSFRKEAYEARSFNILKIGLERERADLYNRIDLRMESMILNGLFEEAQNLYRYRKQNALQTVGYKEIFDYLDGKQDKEETVRLLKRNSRRYAKRQLTWFKKDKEFTWFHPENEDEIIKWIEDYIAALNAH